MRIMIVWILGCYCLVNAETIDLSGQWRFGLDPENQGIAQKWFTQDLKETCKLPGTTDQNGFGTPSTLKPELTKPVLQHLTRKHTYLGPAWYQTTIDIPESWKNRKVELFLERVLWESTIWVDDQKIGSADSLVTPHVYQFDAAPGKHRLTIRIDNSYKYNIGKMAHAYTDETQTIWNGIIGKINLQPVNPVSIRHIQVWPDIVNKKVRLDISVQNTLPKISLLITLSAKSTDTASNHQPLDRQMEVQMEAGDSIIQAVYELGTDALLWDEFSPALYDLQVKISAGDYIDQKTVRFGLREIASKDGRFVINGRPILIRGTLECCIFPLTGHPPMDIAEWKRILGIAKSYGLNHLRFHSWCPPQAAFAAADELGFYFQVELPVWVNNIGKDKPRDAFLGNEADRIIDSYGNHPSFCMWSMGNELEGDFDFLNTLVTRLKNKDGRHLYTATSYTFQKPHGLWPEPVDDFYISQCTKLGWIRGQGFFNQQKPSTSLDFQSSVEGCPVPVLSHEIGQYSVYPNLREINKYKGVLEPLNFIAVREDLKTKKMLPLADSFTKASGMLSAILYKEDIELSLRTFGVGGYQLLDLHDFPGQSTALVGLLDAFWDNKGFITPQQFRRFGSSTVPLLRMDKRVFANTETFTAKTEMAHFGATPLKNIQASWQITDTAGAIVTQGTFDKRDIPFGKGIELGTITFDLSFIQKAQKLNVRVQLDGTECINDWDFWVYPAQGDIEPADDIFVAQRWNDEVQSVLKKGGKVLLLADAAVLKDKVQGMFVPVFWSPVHFPNQPGTMGILCDPKHSALSDFPTEFHTNWQWWELLTQSVSVSLDEVDTGFTPIVRMVDNFAKNRNLTNLFEAKVGSGKLLFCSIDIQTDLNTRPVARQLKRSLIAYVNSDQFNPAQTLKPEFIQDLFNKASALTEWGAKIVSCDSFAAGFQAANAIDNNPATIWHTSWEPTPKPYPHEIVIELIKPASIKGLTVLPRQDNNRNGWIARYELYLSPDGKDWGNPAAAGIFTKDTSLKKILIDDPDAIYSDKSRQIRFIKLVATQGFDGDSFASIAELDVIVENTR